jgi:hypothetical protein
LEGLAQNIRFDPAILAHGWQITSVVLAVVRDTQRDARRRQGDVTTTTRDVTFAPGVARAASRTLAEGGVGRAIDTLQATSRVED